MGSAVSAALSPLGGIAGSVGGVAGGIVGDTISPILDKIKQLIPVTPVANQAQAQALINAQMGISNNAGNTGYGIQNQANQTLQGAQNSLNNAQGTINTAQTYNMGGNVAPALDLLKQQAQGIGPAAQQAKAMLTSGAKQAIAQQHALANSGNATQMVAGQKTAMDNAANITQQSANQAAQLLAAQQGQAQQTYASGAAQQASQAAQNAGLQQQQTAQQANLYGTQVGAGLGYNQLASSLSGNALTGQTNILGVEQGALSQTAQNLAQAVGGGLNAIGGGATALSDKESKTDIQGISSEYMGVDNTGSRIKKGFIEGRPYTLSDEKEKVKSKRKDKIAKFLDAIEAVSFKYKEPDGKMGKTPGEHLGVIAQQVEKAPGGKAMIVETPEGKGIDLASAVGTLLAAASETHERVKELESLFEAKRKGRR